MIIIFLLFLIFVLLISLIFCIIKIFDYEDKIEEMVDSLQNVYYVLVNQHNKIEAKTKIEIFSDEPIIKDLVSDISLARDSVKECSETINKLVLIESEINEKQKI